MSLNLKSSLRLARLFRWRPSQLFVTKQQLYCSFWTSASNCYSFRCRSTYKLTCSSCHGSLPPEFIWNKIIREPPVMAASAPSFSNCDVVPQQCYRRTAEESPAVSAPLATFTTYRTSSQRKGSSQPTTIVDIAVHAACKLPPQEMKVGRTLF